jgi:hypothetical protein
MDRHYLCATCGRSWFGLRDAHVCQPVITLVHGGGVCVRCQRTPEEARVATCDPLNPHASHVFVTGTEDA